MLGSGTRTALIGAPPAGCPPPAVGAVPVPAVVPPAAVEPAVVVAAPPPGGCMTMSVSVYVPAVSPARRHPVTVRGPPPRPWPPLAWGSWLAVPAVPVDWAARPTANMAATQVAVKTRFMCVPPAGLLGEPQILVSRAGNGRIQASFGGVFGAGTAGRAVAELYAAGNCGITLKRER